MLEAVWSSSRRETPIKEEEMKEKKSMYRCREKDSLFHFTHM